MTILLVNALIFAGQCGWPLILAHTTSSILNSILANCVFAVGISQLDAFDALELVFGKTTFGSALGAVFSHLDASDALELVLGKATFSLAVDSFGFRLFPLSILSHFVSNFLFEALGTSNVGTISIPSVLLFDRVMRSNLLGLT